MKHGIRLTRNQKIFLVSEGLNPKEWLCTKNTTRFAEFVNIKNRSTRHFEK